MSSSFGQVFRISTWGESHGTGVGVVIDGCPSLVPVMEEDIQRELDRRRPGQSDIVTPRREEDRAEILSGVLDGIASSYGCMTSFATILSQNGETLHNHYHGNFLETGRMC